MEYNADNVFAKILRRELPAEIIYEDEYALAFTDINPKAPIHVLVISKAMVVDYMDFIEHSPDNEVAGFMRAIVKVVHHLNLEKNGYRLVFNSGPDSGQEVPHLHAHILAGKKLSENL